MQMSWHGSSEYQLITFKSSADFELIVYAFMYALLNGYLLCSKVNVIIYARSGALGGGRTHTWRIILNFKAVRLSETFEFVVESFR